MKGHLATFAGVGEKQKGAGGTGVFVYDYMCTCVCLSIYVHNKRVSPSSLCVQNYKPRDPELYSQFFHCLLLFPEKGNLLRMHEILPNVSHTMSMTLTDSQITVGPQDSL